MANGGDGGKRGDIVGVWVMLWERWERGEMRWILVNVINVGWWTGMEDEDTATLYLTTEWFGSEGWHEHNCAVEYTEGQRVGEILDELSDTWHGWEPGQVGYGVIRAEDGVADGGWPAHAPRGLEWLVNRKGGWRRGMTVGELFAGVEKRADERWFLVISKLDVGRKHVGGGASQVARNVERAVGWLSGLYVVEGMLRQLKRAV